MTTLKTDLNLTGKHLIAGDWVDTDQKFTSDPASIVAYEFSTGTPEPVNRAVQAAENAFG